MAPQNVISLFYEKLSLIANVNIKGFLLQKNGDLGYLILSLELRLEEIHDSVTDILT
ncbi:Hypothetical protein FKW44_014298, partial [Caligus rogercresseyi]